MIYSAQGSYSQRNNACLQTIIIASHQGADLDQPHTHKKIQRRRGVSGAELDSGIVRWGFYD